MHPAAQCLCAPAALLAGFCPCFHLLQEEEFPCFFRDAGSRSEKDPTGRVSLGNGVILISPSIINWILSAACRALPEDADGSFIARRQGSHPASSQPALACSLQDSCNALPAPKQWDFNNFPKEAPPQPNAALGQEGYFSSDGQPKYPLNFISSFPA